MNKIITQADDLTYGDKLNSDVGLQPGDLLLDSVNDQGKVGSYFMANDWKGLVDGGTIWLDGNLIPEGKDILFRNTSDDYLGWGEVKNITIRPIPGTQVKANSFTCLGLLNFKLPGSSIEFPGLTALSNKKFLSGNFGIHVKLNSDKGHGYKISVLDGGTADIEGIESQWGFSGLRFAEGNRITRQKLKLRNFYIHDTDSGEGLYLGQSSGLPAAKLTVEIFDGIIARTACELLQLQHLNGSDIHNLTMVCGDTAWIEAFQPFQDNGIQFQVDAGVNKLYNIIVDGFGSNGIAPFSTDQGQGIKEAEISNILLNEGRHTGHYLHNSNSFGVKWVLKKIFYRQFNNSYARTGKPVVNYICSKNFSTDEFTFQDCVFDKSKLIFFEGPSFGDVKQTDHLAFINYVNSGFVESMDKIMQWRKFFGSYHPISKVTPSVVHYDIGDIVADEHKFYKVVNPHLANLRPKDSSDYLPLTWDENGVRSDMEGFNVSDKQREDPPDDLRLKYDDVWRNMGMGYIEPRNIRDEILEEFRIKTNDFLKTLR